MHHKSNHDEFALSVSTFLSLSHTLSPFLSLLHAHNTGGHSSSPVFKNVREFLRFEWERHAQAQKQERGESQEEQELPTFQAGEVKHVVQIM